MLSPTPGPCCLYMLAFTYGFTSKWTYLTRVVPDIFFASLKPTTEKKRAYEQRIREIEFGSFSPLVFSTKVVFKRLASAGQAGAAIQQSIILASLLHCFSLAQIGHHMMADLSKRKAQFAVPFFIP